MKISKQNQDSILDIAKAIDNGKKTFTQFQLIEFAKKVGSQVNFMVELDDIIKTLETEYNTVLFLEKSHNIVYTLKQHHEDLISENQLKSEIDYIMSDFQENDKKLVNDIFANESGFRLKLMLHSALQIIFLKMKTKIILFASLLIICSCATNKKVALEQKNIENDSIQILKWMPPIKIENDTVKYLKQ